MSEAGQELRLGEVVLRAAGLDGGERDAYLREVAEADVELAARARRRLTAAESLPDSFLDTPAAARLEATEDEPEEPATGMPLPAAERYELGECLGEGGMGRVVKAFDRQLGRSVALKFLTHEDPEILRLFLHEARAQARVQHPHVLEIYDSGELEDRPYIAMRHVAGGTLAEVGPALPLERKVRLLIQAAEGLHASHREGLLHRDVKPSNVLVDETPDGELEALVTDFGLATEFGDADQVTADAVAGSPHYIAPERLTGSLATPTGDSPTTVDRRSDVYSLGVTMYRLFTGGLPFTGEDTIDLLRNALHKDPPSPRQRLPSLPTELEAIILRCMAREPDQRYASARAVAADLKRYLDGEVVDAYAAGVAYRLTRFVLRNKLLVGIAAAAMAALVVAVVAVAVFALRADAARQRADAHRQRAETVSEFLEGLFESADPDAAQGADVTVRQALDRGREKLSRELLDEPEIRADLLATLGTVYHNLGLLGEARELKEEALETRLAADPGDRRALAVDLNNLGRLLYDLGDLAAAGEPYRRALAMWQRQGDDANTALALRNLAALAGQQGDGAGAIVLYRRALAIDRELYGDDDPRVAGSLYGLGARHRLAGDPLRAEPLLRRAQAIYRRSLGADHTRVSAVENSLALVLHAQGRLEEARELFELALSTRRRRLGADDVRVANTEKNLAALRLDQGEVDAAGKLLERALATLRRGRPAGDWMIADAESVWGSYLMAVGRSAEAEAVLRASLATLVEIKGEQDLRTHSVRQRLAAIDRGRDDEEEAAELHAAASSPER